MHEHTVGKWRQRFQNDRIDGLLDEPRPGRPRSIEDDQVAAVIERTLRGYPPNRGRPSVYALPAKPARPIIRAGPLTRINDAGVVVIIGVTMTWGDPPERN